jgi:hypothetical protein
MSSAAPFLGTRPLVQYMQLIEGMLGADGTGGE